MTAGADQLGCGRARMGSLPYPFATVTSAPWALNPRLSLPAPIVRWDCTAYWLGLHSLTVSSTGAVQLTWLGLHSLTNTEARSIREDVNGTGPPQQHLPNNPAARPISIKPSIERQSHKELMCLLAAPNE